MSFALFGNIFCHLALPLLIAAPQGEAHTARVSTTRPRWPCLGGCPAARAPSHPGCEPCVFTCSSSLKAFLRSVSICAPLSSQLSHVASSEESWRASRCSQSIVFQEDCSSHEDSHFSAWSAAGEPPGSAPTARRWLSVPVALAPWGGVLPSSCLVTDCALLLLFFGVLIFFLMMFSCS